MPVTLACSSQLQTQHLASEHAASLVSRHVVLDHRQHPSHSNPLAIDPSPLPAHLTEGLKVWLLLKRVSLLFCHPPALVGERKLAAVRQSLVVTFDFEGEVALGLHMPLHQASKAVAEAKLTQQGGAYNVVLGEKHLAEGTVTSRLTEPRWRWLAYRFITASEHGAILWLWGKPPNVMQQSSHDRFFVYLSCHHVQR